MITFRAMLKVTIIYLLGFSILVGLNYCNEISNQSKIEEHQELIDELSSLRQQYNENGDF